MTSTTPERWASIKALFQSALPLGPAERDAHLSTACEGDPALRGEVESLLASHDAAPTFLEVSALSVAAHVDREDGPRERIGSYRVLKEIGRGGMGTVYLAERDDGEFRRRVAIKLINRGMDTDVVVHRFWHERQILADLDHPNIARLLDGGATADGRPYFVMEYVEGEPIDRWCEARGLSIEERLGLFRTVCSAVEHAHRHLVVHRDLKPGNILVTLDGTPKLLDFGIAKMLEPGVAGDATVATFAALHVMTPKYASPEQVRGGAITTASDVYALGVLLYRMLVKRHPYPVDDLPPDEVARVVCERTPPKPSSVVEGDSRRRLRGDLDTIVGKALHKDPARRYPTVAELDADLERHLEGRPVLARPDRFGYRARKFAGRHRIPVTIAALLLLSLVGGFVATTWQMRVARAERARAERRFDEVRRLARAVIFDYNDAIYDLPGSTPVRERLVQDAITYLESLSGEANGDLALRKELGEGYYKVGEVQARLGDLEGSLRSHGRARDILEALAAAVPDDVEVLRSLAAAHRMVADRKTDTGDVAGALTEHLRALEIRRRIRSLGPPDVASWVDVLDSHLFVGRARLSLGEYEPALVSLRRAVAIGDSLLEAHPLDPGVQFDAMTAWYTLATGLASVGDLDGAARNFARGLETTRALAAADPVHAGYRQALSRTLVRTARIHVLRGAPTEALAALDEALAITAGLAEDDPANAETRLDLATIHGVRGDAFTALDRTEPALREYRASAVLAQDVIRADPSHVRARRVLASTFRGEGDLRVRSGDPAAGLDPLQRSLSAFVRLLESDPSNVELRHEVATAHARIGIAHQLQAGPVGGGLHRAAACSALERSRAEWDALRRTGRFSDAHRVPWLETVRAAAACAPPPARERVS